MNTIDINSLPTFLGQDYPTLWLFATTLLFALYGILDGFDLGAGAWHLFLKKGDHRELAIKVIGPVWDGNEVFLVIGGGALFAGFREVYATLFSAMYIPLILFLMFLIFRAVSIEFRNKEEMLWWRKSWDVGYGVASTALPLLLGVVLANILQGMPLDQYFEFTGSWLGFLNPYALLIGLTTLSFSMIHGASYLLLKTEGNLYKRVFFLVKKILPIFIILYVASLIWSITKISEEFDRLASVSILLTVITLILGLIIYSVYKERFRMAFLSNVLVMLLTGVLAVVMLFPVIIPSTTDPLNSLTIYNSCSSQKTLKIMLTVSTVGIPLIIGYVIFAYRVFWGKVTKEDVGY